MAVPGDILDACAELLDARGFPVDELGHPDNDELRALAATTLTLSTNLDDDQADLVVETLAWG